MDGSLEQNMLSLNVAFEFQDFKQGYCLFEGNLLDHLNFVPEETMCQMACQHISGCQYYVFDKNLKDCMLLDSESRHCDLIRGKKDSPNYDTCK